jgi:DNA primase
LRPAIRKIKEEVSLADYAGEITELRRSGSSLRGKCPVHGGDNPTAFKVDGDLFHCKTRCDRGGDIITLYQMVEGCEERWEAVVGLAMRYGIELPRRPDGWHEFNSEKDRRRKAIKDILATRYRRLYWRMLGGHLMGEEESKVLWDDAWMLSASSAEWRMSQ